MSVESIGSIYSVNIPGLTDAADIQAAFQAYHYGSYTSVATTAGIASGGITYWLKEIETDIVALENRPSSGGEVNTTQPAASSFTPAEIPDGFIWVDQDGAVTGSPISATAVFTNSAPSTSLTTGTIWVDKDATNVIDNPFIPQAIIAAKGDLLAGSTSDTVVVLTVGSNGQLLKADSSTTSGLAWTNTLTSPVISGTTTTVSGNLAIQPASYVLEVQGGGSTDASIQLNCYVNSHGQKIKSQPHSESATNTLLLPGGNTIGNGNSTLVSEIGTQTLTNKTLTSPLISGGTSTTTTVAYPILISPEERLNVSATTSTGTINFDLATAGTLYHTANAAANHTLNFRFSSNTSLTNVLTTNDSITAVFMNTNGATAYYPNVITVDGATSGVSVKYQGGTAFSAGNASSIDAYVFNIIKTAATSYTVLASQTKFA